MDPAPQASSGRRSGRGGKGNGAKRLGMKTASPVPSPPSPSAPPPPPPPPSSSPAPAPVQSPPFSAPATPTLSPGAPQAAGWGGMVPNFPSQHGNQEAPNQRAFYPGGFTNILHQGQYPPHPHMQGQNFHFVGQNMSFNPMSPPSADGTATSKPVKQGSSTKETVIVDIEEGKNTEANTTATKRYWTHEEEERLASAWLNASKDPIKGNDKKIDTFWKEVTDEFNRKGNGQRIRETNQLKVHWSRLKSAIGEFNDYWTKPCARLKAI